MQKAICTVPLQLSDILVIEEGHNLLLIATADIHMGGASDERFHFGRKGFDYGYR